MGTEENTRVVGEFDAILTTGEVDRLDELCRPDLVNHALAPDRPAGLAGTREFLTTMGRRMQTDGWQEVHVVAERDLVVQYGVRGGTWLGGRFLGWELEAGRYQRDVAFMYRLVDGRIAERWAVRDDLTMIRQLSGRVADAAT
jgi:predicted ester cyclase